MAAAQSVGASSAEGPTIEAAGYGGGYIWTPSAATVSAGGTVTFSSPSATVPHGVTWTAGPEPPGCSGVPIDQEKTSWSGSCSFAQPGTYAFVCTVHPVEMKGTIAVGSTAAPPAPPPPPGGASESPLEGRAARALRLAKNQRGRRVRGSVVLSEASAGGKLEVRLFANRASLSAARRSGTSRVGRLVRRHLEAGRVSFSVPLKRVARLALARLEKLRLSVKLVITPPSRAALTLKKGVVLHG